RTPRLPCWYVRHSSCRLPTPIKLNGLPAAGGDGSVVTRRSGVTRATSSILFRTALAYLVITLLNITVFVLLVFENQIDLISQNAVISSLNAGTAIKYSLDALAADGRPLDPAAFQRIEDIATKSGVLRATVFGEDGRVLFRSGPA